MNHRFFFCLRPPALVAAAVGRFRESLGLAGGAVSDERLHLTLAITDDHPAYPRSLVDRLLEIGDATSAEPVAVTLDRLSSNGSVVALRPSRSLPQLAALRRELGRRFSCSGIQREGWRFNPHVTLTYRKCQPFLRHVAPFVWEAAEVVLVHSLLGKTKHVELGRWPLVRRQLDLLLH